ncbi:MAG TPA: c(7)-type cytochrome triheme domain-containing protein [Anaeromyxobacter sp.]
MIRLVALAAMFLALPVRGDEPGTRKRRTPPQEFGRVVNQVKKSKMGPVVFDHWLHRAKYTCRVCHVDVGFAMKAGGTDIRAADNASGMYCGACHNERAKADGGARIFAACKIPAPADAGACGRCHGVPGGEPRHQYDFASFTKDLPRGRFGNGVDWEIAEQRRLVKPVDFVEGLSVKRAPMPVQKDFALGPKLAGMPEIIFSHAKHTVWSGCEGCHPEIFTGVKRGTTKFSMVEIFDGKFCGACHVNVAFPLGDCQRCHSKPVQ